MAFLTHVMLCWNRDCTKSEISQAGRRGEDDSNASVRRAFPLVTPSYSLKSLRQSQAAIERHGDFRRQLHRQRIDKERVEFIAISTRRM